MSKVRKAQPSQHHKLLVEMILNEKLTGPLLGDQIQNGRFWKVGRFRGSTSWVNFTLVCKVNARENDIWYMHQPLLEGIGKGVIFLFLGFATDNRLYIYSYHHFFLFSKNTSKGKMLEIDSCLLSQICSVQRFFISLTLKLHSLVILPWSDSSRKY